MNIEELELSLRSEFEGQLNAVVARVRQDVADFQKTFEAEFEKQREQFLRSIDELATRLPESFPIENAFKSTITEHLRLARDEGAQIAATAFGEAEKMRTDNSTAASGANSDKIRDAVNEISSKRTQAAILTALVDHASHFASRGAFFIVKNENFVGWKAFGLDSGEAAVREIHFPAKCFSILSDAVGSLSTTRSEYGAFVDDCNFLDPLGLGQPSEMHAIPLSARGRGVAVLYVDKGADDKAPNVEALETLVRVAGLTVELLAAHSAKPSAEVAEQVDAKSDGPTPPESVQAAEEATVEETVSTSEAEHEAGIEYESAEFAEEASDTVSTAAFEPETARSYEFETSSAVEADSALAAYEFESNSSYEFEAAPTPAYEAVEVAEPVVETVHEALSSDTNSFEPAEDANSFEFSSNDSYDASASVENDIPYVEFAAEEVSVVSNGNGHVRVPEPAAAPSLPEPVVDTATVEVAKPRLRDRNVDLPIEVADEERKLHNDARRFARLLVSEIKLYNEQKVAEGREKYDLYDRLREAIDRSREMYEKRVQPAVASKFDYFHYELVNGLAEMDAKKLGGNYPGASV